MGHYESTLERDMMELIRFDQNVSQFTAQPLTISYFSADKKNRSYTPDGLIHYHPTQPRSQTILYEVKFREDFRRDWRIYLPKFRAAKSYCLERGWEFQVLTEKEIRTPYLTNVKFLWPFLSRKAEPTARDCLINALHDLGETNPDILLRALSARPFERGLQLPLLWHLIGIGEVGCNLGETLTMSTKIWPIKASEL